VGLNRDPHYRRNDDWSSMTLDEYHALDPGRPLTDAPIGGMTDARRSTSALASAVVSETLGFVPTKGTILDTLARLSEDDTRIYPDCGTTLALERHYRHKTPPCDDCLEAPRRPRRPGKTRPRRRNPGEPTGEVA
jgi:hypothetical protein